MHRIGFISFVGLLLVLSACNHNPGPSALDSFAQCVTDSGAIIFTSVTCSHCREQQRLFGDSYEFIEAIECSPNARNSEAQRCLLANIRGTPTWVLYKDGKEVDRLEGRQALEDLAIFTGCPLEVGE